MAPTPSTERAQQVLQVLPRLNRWATKCVLRVGADVGLSLRQYAALHRIGEGASSASEIARWWQVTPAVVTGILDRLERRGLVRREPDPKDRRRACLALTSEGLAACRSVEGALTGELAAQLASAPLAELDALRRALALLERSLDALEVRGAAPPRARAPVRTPSPAHRRSKLAR